MTYPDIPSPSARVQDPGSSTQDFKLLICQQPEKARLCSYKERVDRRPLDPPPIIQLFSKLSEDRYANFFLYATLVNKDGDIDLTLKDHTRTTAGMVVQSLHKLKGANSQEGAYFVFSDISVRLEGFFRLKFTLFEISGLRMRRRNSVLSNVFQVFSPKTFPGMSESTELTQFLSKQGLHIRVRKASKTQSEASPVKRRKTQNATTEWRIYHPEPMYESQPTLPSVQTSSQCAQSIMSVRNILISPSQRAPDHQPRLPYHTLPPPIPSLNTFHHPTRTNPQSASIVTPTSSLLFRPFHSK